MKKLVQLVYLGLCIFLLAPVANAQDKEPVRIIYDADMGPMIDDVGGLAVLHALADKGEAKILATIASNRHPTIAQTFDVLNTYYGHPNIPIGVPRGPAVEIKDVPEFPILGGWTNYIVQNYPHDVRSNDVVPGATDLYRRVLSEQPDNSVVIVTVGFMTPLADLLASVPDEYSDLNGKELIEKKVKRVVSMAGAFPDGREYNLYKDMRASKFAFENWPTEIIYSGFEIGKKVQTGYEIIQNDEIQNNPVRDVYRMKIDKNRSSFDQTAVLVGVRGVDPYYELVEGKITVNWDGSNGWNSNGKGQYYLVEKQDPQQVADLIDELMQYVPDRYSK